MERWLDQPVGEWRDLELRVLLDELTDAAGVNHRDSTIHFLPFLINCLHPSGSGTPRVLLHLQRTRPGYLEKRIDKIESPSVLALFRELAAVIYQPHQLHRTKKLMAFFNHVVRVLEKKRPKRKPL